MPAEVSGEPAEGSPRRRRQKPAAAATTGRPARGGGGGSGQPGEQPAATPPATVSGAAAVAPPPGCTLPWYRAVAAAGLTAELETSALVGGRAAVVGKVRKGEVSLSEQTKAARLSLGVLLPADTCPPQEFPVFEVTATVAGRVTHTPAVISHPPSGGLPLGFATPFQHLFGGRGVELAE